MPNSTDAALKAIFVQTVFVVSSAQSDIQMAELCGESTQNSVLLFARHLNPGFIHGLIRLLFGRRPYINVQFLLS